MLKIEKGQLVATHRRNADIVLTPFQRDWYHGSVDYFGKVIPVRNSAGRVVGLNVSAQRVRSITFQKVSPRPR